MCYETDMMNRAFSHAADCKVNGLTYDEYLECTDFTTCSEYISEHTYNEIPLHIDLDTM